MTMNKLTVEFHLLNISKNMKYEYHEKELKKEISFLRMGALKTTGKVSDDLHKKANEIESQLKEALAKRFE